ncbi:hypothetical protein BB559_006301, partial [Furculomyces boomerangus]
MVFKSVILGSLMAATTLSASIKPQLVVFGDSLSDIGNIENSTRAAPRWNGHFSTGPLWNEYLAYYKNYTLVNYAIGGATSNNTFVNLMTQGNYTNPSILDEIATYTDVFGGKYNASALVNDIAVVGIGANDFIYASKLLVANEINMVTFTDGVVSNIINTVQSLITFGYRKLLVADISDLKALPIFLPFGETGGSNVDKYVTTVNTKLTVATQRLATDNSKSVEYIRVVNLYKFLSVLTNKNVTDVLGITVIDKECYPVTENNTLISSCDNPDQYVFTDEVHPTTTVQALLGATFAEIIDNGSFNYTEANLLALIKEYNVTSAKSQTNFLYSSPDSAKTGKLVIDEYNIKQSIANAPALIKEKNAASSNSTSGNSTSGNSTSTSSTTKPSGSSRNFVSAIIPVSLISLILLGSINSSKLLDTGPEKNPKENRQKLNVLEIKQEKNEKNQKEATVTATASNKNNVSGSSGAGSTLDIPSSTASVTENKTSAIKRVEKHKIKLQTPLFAPYSKPNPKKKLNKPTGNVAPMQIKKENTDFNEINDIEIEDGEVIEYEDGSIISAADNVTQINSDEIAIDDNNNDPSDHEMLNTQEVNSMNEYFAEKN